MLKKSAIGGKSPGIAMAYARVGDFKTAATLADRGKDMYAWNVIAEEMDAHHDLELAKLAKAGYLIANLQNPIMDRDVLLTSTFQIQWQLDDPAAKATSACLVKEAIQAITENKQDWDSVNNCIFRGNRRPDRR